MYCYGSSIRVQTFLAALILYCVLQYLPTDYQLLHHIPFSPVPSETTQVHIPSSLQRDCGFELRSVLNASPDVRHDGQSCNVLKAMTTGVRAIYGGRFQVPNCPLKWYQRDSDSGNLCELLPRWGRILVVGDSYMRQLTQAIWMIAADDFKRGGIAPLQAEDATYNNCTCDLQFTRGCRALSRRDVKGT